MSAPTTTARLAALFLAVPMSADPWCEEHGHPYFASIVRGVGDVNADGKPDFAVCDPSCSQVWILSGLDGSLLSELESPRNHGLGLDASPIGDVDGDGHDDFILAAESKAAVISGRDFRTLRVLVGNVMEEGFARFVAGVGDVDGDSVPDYAVAGATAGTRESDWVFASVFSGRDGRVLLSVPDPHPVLADTKNASAPARLLGSLCRIGDVDGDGRADIGVAWWAARFDPSSSSDRLVVQVLSGRSGQRIVQSSIALKDAVVPVRLAAGVDLDGNGRPDLVVSVPDTGIFAASSTTGDILFQALTRSDVYLDGLGAAAVVVPDADGDGKGDIVFSASSDGVAAQGSVSLLASRSGKRAWTRVGEDDLDLMTFHFGSTLDAIGDLDGDGCTEIVVGVDHSRYHGPGRAFVLSGKDGRLLGDFVRVGDGVHGGLKFADAARK